MNQRIQCAVYRASKRSDTYLFVSSGDELDRVPAGLLQLLGRLDFATEAESDPDVVMHHLAEQGYYLQLPPQGPGHDDAIN